MEMDRERWIGNGRREGKERKGRREGRKWNLGGVCDIGLGGIAAPGLNPQSIALFLYQQLWR